MGIWRALLAVMRRVRPSQSEDVARELQAHLELEIEEQRDRGLSADEARRTAHRLFGNPTLVKEEVRNLSPWMWWERLGQDVRYGLRIFRRSPAFAATAVLSLTFGIGASTAIFSVMNAALLRPLPVSRPDDLAVLTNGSIGGFSYPAYRDLRDGSRTFSDLMAAARSRRVGISVEADSEQADVKMVSGNYFRGLGVPPVAGRMFTSADELEPVAVVSYGYWQSRFAGAAAVVGQPVNIGGIPFTIVGVAPAAFFGEAPGESPDVWTSFALEELQRREERGFTWLNLIGRLTPGASLARAQAEILALQAQQQPEGDTRLSPLQPVEISSGARGLSIVRQLLDPLAVLMAIAGAVLLIACANLASLLLTRGAARQWEIAMRLAIGATRGRIVRQLMTESLLLAVAGGALGLAFAFWGSRMLMRLVSIDNRGFVLDLGPDSRVLLFTAVVSIAAAVLFGLAPALRAVRPGLGPAMSEGHPRAVGRARRWGLGDSFLVVQIALSLILLAGGTMFIRTLRNLETQDLGFRSDRLLVVEVGRERGYRPDVPTLVPRLLARVDAIPGVETASVAMLAPLSSSGSGVNGLQVDGYVPRDDEDRRARANWVGPSYFRAVGIGLVAGRDFSPADNAPAQKVAVVNETMARHYFGEHSAIGRRVTFNKDVYEIVGVAADAKYYTLREATPRMLYFSVLQGGGFRTLHVRTSSGDPAAAAAAVRLAIRDVDPRLSAGEILTGAAQIDRALSLERLVATLSGFLSGLTLLLVSIGIYGTLAFTAAKQAKEIGLRLALGATRGAVVWMVLRDVVVRLTVGVGLGTIGVFTGGRLVASLLFRLQPTDIATIAIAVGLLVSVVLAAGVLPALRASRLDPAKILRE